MHWHVRVVSQVELVVGVLLEGQLSGNGTSPLAAAIVARQLLPRLLNDTTITAGTVTDYPWCVHWHVACYSSPYPVPLAMEKMLR